MDDEAGRAAVATRKKITATKFSIFTSDENQPYFRLAFCISSNVYTYSFTNQASTECLKIALRVEKKRNLYFLPSCFTNLILSLSVSFKVSYRQTARGDGLVKMVWMCGEEIEAEQILI